MCTAAVSWDDPQLRRRAHEVIFPPRAIDACDAKHIFRGLLSNFEDFAFSKDFESFLADAAKAYKYVTLSAVGDSASANCSGVVKFFMLLHQLAKRHNMNLTAIFLPCFLHQFSRVLLLHLDHTAVTAPLYSMSRMHQNASTRKATCLTLKRLVAGRFRFRENTFPPNVPTTSPSFREHLLKLLTGSWDPDTMNDDEQQLLQQALKFFNGNLLDQGHWMHYCTGRDCHTNESHAANDAAGLHRLEVRCGAL